MTIQYNIDDLKNKNTSLLKEYENINTATTSLNKLIGDINTHWTGAAKTTYISSLNSRIKTITSYSNELQRIANNLSIIADYYEKHEEEYSQKLW